METTPLLILTPLADKWVTHVIFSFDIQPYGRCEGQADNTQRWQRSAGQRPAWSHDPSHHQCPFPRAVDVWAGVPLQLGLPDGGGGGSQFRLAHPRAASPPVTSNQACTPRAARPSQRRGWTIGEHGATALAEVQRCVQRRARSRPECAPVVFAYPPISHLAGG